MELRKWKKLEAILLMLHVRVFITTVLHKEVSGQIGFIWIFTCPNRARWNVLYLIPKTKNIFHTTVGYISWTSLLWHMVVNICTKSVEKGERSAAELRDNCWEGTLVSCDQTNGASPNVGYFLDDYLRFILSFIFLYWL